MTNDKGLSVFMTKSAEVEPWLVPHAFVQPPDFQFLKGMHSNIIYAKPGNGKTAIALALEDYALTTLKCLPVRWKPDLAVNLQTPSTEIAITQFADILSSCAHQIIEALPKDFKRRVKDDRNYDFLVEFLHDFSPPEDQELLSEKVPMSKSRITNRDTRLETIAVELIKSIRFAGYPGGIWILMDGLDWSSEAQKRTAISILQSIFSTLSLFEIGNFHFKMFLPLELERELSETSAILKERATPSRISWDDDQLRMVIEKRLRFALNDERVRVDQIHPAEELFAWLEGCGGLSPRGWLEYFRPIFATVWEVYTSEGLRRLKKKEWNAARKRSSLQLRFDPESSQVIVGMNSPKVLSQEGVAILSYLYKNEGRYCSKREIYNKAYLARFAQGEGKEITSDDVFDYEGLLNQAIRRLRVIFEPLPKDPVFLTTKKDMGYRLSLQAFSENE